MEQLTGAQLTIKLLEQQGITTIAGIPGGANLPLYDALYASEQIHHILTRHEQGAGFIAQGMARSTGKPSVCFATSGPGATNLITAMADAYLDSIPVVFITGQVPLSMIGTDAFQEVDMYGLSIPITKHNYLIRSAAELTKVIPEAFSLAVNGRPGPILIDIPKNVQNELFSLDRLPKLTSPTPFRFDTPSKEKLELAADIINHAKRPVLYIGGGVIHADAADVVREFAEKNNIPTTMTLMGLGVIPTEHPLYMGMLGMHASRATNLTMLESDLLIAVGVRFDDRATGKISEFCPKAKIIHMDIDPCEISKLRTAHLGLVGDVKTSLNMLLPYLEEKQRTDWLNNTHQLQQKHPLFCQENLDNTRPYSIILQAAELAGEDAIVTTDVGKHQMWTAQAYPFSKSRQFLTSGGLGTMGFGMPTAIGAAIAHPDKIVLCFSGDGSIMMNIQELATAVEQQANIKIILFNNQSLGLVRQQQSLFYEKHYFASEYQHQVDFCTIAKGFGISSFDVKNTDNLPEILEQAFSTNGPALIHIPIDIEEDVYPMVPPGAANTTMIGGEIEHECA